MSGPIVIIVCLLVAAASAAAGFFFALLRGSSASRQTQLDLAARTAQLQQTQTDLAAARQSEQTLLARLSQAENAVTEARTRLEQSEKNLADQRQLLQSAESDLREAFSALSSKALENAGKQFLDLAETRFASLSKQAQGTLDERKAQFETAMAPLVQLMQSYQTRLAEIEQARTTGYGQLQSHLAMLAETHRALQSQTTQLVGALKKPGGRGRWGELTLRRLIELSGLTHRCDFEEQLSLQATADSDAARPDAVIHLPGSRHIIVDAKAPIDAFLDAIEATTDEARTAKLNQHAGQVRSRAKELASKQYWQKLPGTPEFVVMFLPGEAFFSAAVDSDPTLYSDILQSRVIIATPTTLLALLRSIEFGWRQSDLMKNADDIRKLGAELYSRIASATGHIEKLGDHLGKSVKAYNDFLGSYESRVLVSARKMSELGVTSAPMPDVESIELAPRPPALPMPSSNA